MSSPHSPWVHPPPANQLSVRQPPFASEGLFPRRGTRTSRQRSTLRQWLQQIPWACAFLSACAGPGQERHLAPFVSELSRAGGETELEALGGALIVRRQADTHAVNYWALRPLASHSRSQADRSESTFLPPFGRMVLTPREHVYQLLPLARYSRQFYPDAPATWTFFGLPGVYWSKTNDGRIVRALVPFGGVVEHFLSFDRLEFVLLPLYMRYRRHGRTTTHVLMPFFSWSNPTEPKEDPLADEPPPEGRGGKDWRLWPLVGVNRWEGRYERWFFLWPFFHWQRNDLQRPPEQQDKRWMAWPLVGAQERGASRSWMALWPFFGYSSNKDKGFWAWDGPWPLVTVQRPGSTGMARRTRVWPFYSKYEGDDMTSTHLLWPLFNKRTEVYGNTVKNTTLLLPIYQAWDKVSPEGTSHWRKVFPLFTRFTSEAEDETQFAFPAPNPFTWRLDFIDEHYAWMWQLYSSREKQGRLHERSWLGLWRRERDEREDRRSFVGLWARRDYREQGADVREHSILFGLLRWRSSPQGVDFLRPAFPGPGWPLDRVPPHEPK